MPAVISDDECVKFAKCFLAAPPGVFRLTDIPPPPDESPKWPFHLLERRDASHLQALAVASVESLDMIVIDGARSVHRPAEERGPVARTVTAFAVSGGEPTLLAIRRGEDFGEEDAEGTRSMTSEALKEVHGLIGKGMGRQAAAPVVCLDQELATARERRRLLADGVPYALRVHGDSGFSYPTWNNEDPFDDFVSTTPASIIAAYRSEADPAKPVFVPIRDLQGSGNSSRMLEEYLYRLPSPDGDEYFVVRPALLPSVTTAKLLRNVRALAGAALSCVRQPPGRALRLHEFQHHNSERYCQAVNIVARGCGLEPLLGKDSGTAAPVA